MANIYLGCKGQFRVKYNDGEFPYNDWMVLRGLDFIRATVESNKNGELVSIWNN